MEIGLQVYSVRQNMEKDFWAALEKVAEIGYRNIEFANHIADQDPGIGHHIDAYKLKDKMDQLGLKTIGNHVHPFDKADMDKVIEYNKIIGNDSIGCGIGFFSGTDSAIAFAKWLNKIGGICADSGMTFYYHNHYQEFQRFDGKTVMDILLENTDEDFVKFELDTFWTLRGGVDPVEYLKILGDRCILIHQKDLSKDTSPVNIFDKIGKDADLSEMKNFGVFSQTDFTEIGEGAMDIKKIIDTAQELGHAKCIILEQDYSSRNELESIEISYNNLAGMIG